MAVHPDVAELLRVVPADRRGGEQIDWLAAEAVLGTRLPSDYMSFLDTYGAGDIGELVIVPPLPVEVPGWEACHMATASRNLRTLWAADSGVPGVDATGGTVLAWGTGANANELGWLTTDPDPQNWPVVVWRRQVGRDTSPWAMFDCGMAGFLSRLMLARFDECPLGDESLWGKPGRFVSWREQHRRSVEGLDPFTGEPDPYADMFPATGQS